MTYALLQQFDAQIRRGITAEPGLRVERTDRLVRVSGAWNCILFANLDEATAADAVSAEVEYFRSRGEPVQWKVYGHDEPPTLPSLLENAGFSLAASETLMVLDTERDSLDMTVPAGVVVRRLMAVDELRDVATVSEAVFGDSFAGLIAEFAARLHLDTLALYVAYQGSEPVGAARLELPQGAEFAGLYGGGTVPASRHRGIYRSLVAARARNARERGYRYLNVEAGAASKPILERLGFVALTNVSTWYWQP